MKPTVITTDPTKMAAIYANLATQSHAEAVHSIQAQNTPSPFAEIQRLQDEQREGWVPETPFEGSTQYDLAEKDAKIAEQAAQIVALQKINNDYSAHLVEMRTHAKAIIQAHKLSEVDWQAMRAIESALSTPAPPVVPIEDVRMQRLEDFCDGWMAALAATSDPTEPQNAVEAFNTKHPL